MIEDKNNQFGDNNEPKEEIEGINPTGYNKKTGPAIFSSEKIELESDEYTGDDLEVNKFYAPESSIELEQAQNKIEQLEEELAVVKNKFLREAAEVENTRKRMLKERDDAKKFSIASFAKDLLDVSDNFERALGAAPENKDGLDDSLKSLLEGIEATQRAMTRSFEKNGIVKLEPKDQKFDPNFHEVMFEAPMPDKENGFIIQIIECGYTLHGRLIRPARVGIAKNPDDNKPTRHQIDEQV